MSSRENTRKNKKNHADVIIIGGGLAGLTLSCLLGTHDIKVICIDRVPYNESVVPAFDGRTTAISYGSQKVMAAANSWNGLEEHACPIRTIQILDGANSPVRLEFSSEEVGDRIFGWILENRLIRKSLFQQLKSLKTVQHKAPYIVSDFTVNNDHVNVHTNEGDVFTAPLVVGADGRQSFTREWMGIGTRDWSYKQNAVVCTVEHQNPHNFVAVEHFHEQGPFAILPMTDSSKGHHRSSVVWTEHGPTKNSAINFSAESFDAALTARFPDWYGKVKLTGQRFSYPLGLIHAHSYIGERMALIADAAHGIHPIAGQGLNMGLRDVAVISDLIVKTHEQGHDIGNADLLSEYERERKADNVGMAAATDGLNKLFSNNFPPLSIARKIGLRAVSKLPPAKKFFMNQAMGSAGLLPDLIKETKRA